MTLPSCPRARAQKQNVINLLCAVDQLSDIVAKQNHRLVALEGHRTKATKYGVHQGHEGDEQVRWHEGTENNEGDESHGYHEAWSTDEGEKRDEGRWCKGKRIACAN